MKVEARYCDGCGVKIALDELREGDAVQADESVFYCKDCKEKHAPDASREAEAKKEREKEAATAPVKTRPTGKRVSSSRRLVARRLASGRLARSKAKMPPGLTGSGDDLRRDPLTPAGDRTEKSRQERKLKLEERARIRARLELAKKKGPPASSVEDKPLAKAETVDVRPLKTPGSDSAPVASDSDVKKDEESTPESDAAVAAAPVKKKKKKKKKGKKGKKKKAREAAEAEARVVAEAAEAVARAKKQRKADSEPESEKLDELEEIPEDEGKGARGDKPKKKDARKDESDEDDKADKAEDEAAASKTPSKAKMASRVRPRLGSRTDVPTPEAEEVEAKKKSLPVKPVVILGALCGILIIVGAAIAFGGGNKPVDPAIAKIDPKEYLDDLRHLGTEQASDPDELVARWEGLSDAIEGDAKGEAVNEGQAVRGRLQTQAQTELGDLDRKIDACLHATPADYDGAQKALADFPRRLRTTQAWIAHGRERAEDILRRKAAYLTGTALLAEARRAWTADKNSDAVSGLFAAFPEDQQKTEEGQKIAEEFQKLVSEAVHAGIDASHDKATKERAQKEKEAWQKLCERRAKIVKESEAADQVEIGTDLFEWQVRPPHVNTKEANETAFKVKDGRLTITSSSDREPMFFGKGKRDWASYTLEFKIKVAKGTKCWFLGRVSGTRGGYSWDKLAISSSAVGSEKDKPKFKPNFFEGIKEDEWVTLQFRVISNNWDVVVNGTTVHGAWVQENHGGATGGFGFMINKGSVEVEGLKARVLAHKGPGQDGGDDEED